MRAWVLASLAVLLLLPRVALAQGPVAPTGPPPILPPMTPAEAMEHYRQSPPDPAQLEQRRTARETRLRQHGGAPADARTTPKPPDTISPEMRAQRPAPVPPSNPRPPEPRRGEEPTDRLLRLLSLSNAPEEQGGVTCGAGVQTSLVGYWAQYARGVMFCHAPDSFYTSQSMTAFETIWWCSSPQYCAELQVEQLYACGRWAYDWQAWYCPLDTSYVYDALYCPQWTRILQYVTGVSPGPAPQYNDVVSSPWRQGCPIT